MFTSRVAGLLSRLALLLALAVCALQVHAQNPQRPKITGISHVGYFVSDLPSALRFWHDLLGFDEYFQLKKRNSDVVGIDFLKVNDHQHLELYNEQPSHAHNLMSHICFTVDDVGQMRNYLRAQGFPMKEGPNPMSPAGDYAFEIRDPDGMLVEFVQSLPSGQEAQTKGRLMPADRVSDKIFHVGFLVGNSQKSIDFYGRVLGFQEKRSGGANPNQMSSIEMKVPDGDDYIELVPDEQPSDLEWGAMNHLALAVPNIRKTIAALKSRPAFAQYQASGRRITITSGPDGRRQASLYDPDGTRVELTEPFVSGRAATPSGTPPPPPAHD
jgi:catechol 2,3-dioxygenase-like lactoylglutathione lyase family enzyme